MDNQQKADNGQPRIINIQLGESSARDNASVESLSEAIASVIRDNTRAIDRLLPVVESMTKEIFNTDYFSQLHEALDLLLQRIAEVYTFDFSAVFESMRDFSERLSEMLKDIQIPEFSEEQKRKLMESHRQWGEYGWTTNPCADYETFFDVVPANQKEADSVAMKYCSKRYIPLIFEEIRRCKRAKISDFEEAVFAFDSSKYKSCALLLFSLIDAQLIRLQKRSDFDDKQRRRKVGSGAINKTKARAEQDLSEGMLFTALFYENLFSCLLKVFEDGHDFKTQPQVINRNFLNHGMLTKRVSRKDCIQLFLLYYNMLCLLDMVY